MPIAAGRKQRIIKGKTDGKWASGKIGQHRMLCRNTKIFHSVRLQSEAELLPRISTSQKRERESGQTIGNNFFLTGYFLSLLVFGIYKSKA